MRARLLSRISWYSVAGVAVGDHADARLHDHLAVLDDGGAQHDAGVHAAVAREIAGGATVQVAALGLELVDDLHGAHLGSAGERAGGEARYQRVERTVARVELALDMAAD